jgi:hypothetical protein
VDTADVTSIGPDRLAQAVGQACVELGVRPEPADVTARMVPFLREPVEQFHRYLNWPAALNDSGLPVELSIKVDGPGSVALRCVVDPTDYHFGPPGNWQRYVERSIACAGCTTPEQADAVRELCRAHLDGVPPDFPSRLVHGVGFVAPDRGRGSLYFRTGWLDGPGLAARLPEQAAFADELRRRYGCPLPERVEVMGYDFEAGQLRRAKMYTWLPVRADRPFTELAGTHPGLTAAGDLFTRRAHAVAPGAREHAVFLQSSGPGDSSQRLFFFPEAWGWATPAGLHDLLGRLAGDYGVDLQPLLRFRQVLAGHDIRMRLSLVSLADGAAGPSATFYFLPTPAAGASGAPHSAADVARMYEAGVRYLFGRRLASGAWPSVPAQPVPPPSGDLVTAYVAAALSRDPALRGRLGATADRLSAGPAGGPAGTAADPEAAALALVALARLGRSSPAGRPDLPQCVTAGDAEVTGALLAALSDPTAGDPAPEHTTEVLAALLALQRPDGGWTRTRWAHDLVATGRALNALASCPAGPAGADRTGAVRRGAAYVGAAVVARDPFQAALWLGGWLAAGGSLRTATVHRAVELLRDQQRPEGGWAGVPVRLGGSRVAGTAADEDAGYVIDADGVVTTATVVEALHALLQACRRASG